MTAPIWMAFPPEVHSALLSSGPGPGPLLAAAAAWNSLSAEYAAVADELAAVLSTVQAGVWEGPSAESYAAAHAPFLAWLTQASADSAVAAAQHETVASAYTAALAGMPTLAELAANHALHAVLVATNFFGVNTIPIALNEADYARMWVQAATTMSTYHAVATTAVASAPHPDPPPPILKNAGATSAQTAAEEQTTHSGASTGLGDLLAALLQKLGVSPKIIDEFGIDNIENFLNNPLSYIEQHFIYRLLTDPLSLLVNPLYVFYDGDEVFFPLGYAFLPSSVGTLAMASAVSGGAFAGLAGVAGAEPAAALPLAPAPMPAPMPAAPSMLPAAGMAPTLAAPATAPAPAPAPASPASAATSSVPPSPPAPHAAVGTGFVSPYAVGPPGIWFGSGMSTGASSSAKRKAPQPDSAAVAAAAATRERARARRRQRATRRGYGDEFMDMNVEVDPDWGGPPAEEPVASTAPSDQGAGPLGAGTVPNETIAQAAGLTTLAGDEFGGGPAIPMLPNTWQNEKPRDAGETGERGWA
jgi:PPE-repeat protein